MPFMKQGQPWLYDETTGDVIGVKDPDGSEPILRANSRSFTIDSILLIAEQSAHLNAISAK